MFDILLSDEADKDKKEKVGKNISQPFIPLIELFFEL